MSALVLREDREGIARLTLNRPDKLNALSPDLFAELAAHVDAIGAAGERVRCVVLAGAGRSFCAGADVEALRAGVVTEDPDMRSKTIERLALLPQPVIARVHGHCFTGGLELALAADIIVASADTLFCDTHARLGIVPRWGLSARLPRRIGLAAARRLSLTALPVNAGEAFRMGLCDYLAAPEALDAKVSEIAAAMAANVPSAMAVLKRLYNEAFDTPLAEALAHERRLTSGVYAHLAASPDKAP